MKIALFHNLPAGGAKRVLHEHARHLSARGHTLDAFVLDTADEAFLPLAPLCRRVVSYSVPEVAKTGKLAAARFVHHPLARRALGPERYRALADEQNARAEFARRTALDEVYAQIARDLDAGGYDAVYVHQCRLTQSPPLLALTGLPCLYFCQDTLRGFYEWGVNGEDEEKGGDDVPRESRFEERLLGKAVSRPWLRWLRHHERAHIVATRAATRVLANSWYSREAILRTTGVDAHVCRLGVDADFFCPAPADSARPGGPPRVLSVGALAPHKRHEFILRAVAAIPEKRRPILEIVGYEFGVGPGAAGPFETRLCALAERHSVRLTITRDGSDQAVRDAYRRASVFAFAPYLEPFGLVALEAMACQTPVVAVKEGGPREIVTDGMTGRLVARDTAAFADALDDLIAHPDRAETMGAAGRDDVQRNWTWEASGAAVERHLAQISNTGGTVPADFGERAS